MSEAPPTAPQPQSRPVHSQRWLALAMAVGEPLSVAALLVFLLNKTWLRWADPLIDFPKDVYLAWRVSEGDMLYQKVTNWYGPLSHLVEAAAFRVFGVGVDTVVWLNIVLLVVDLLLLRAIFGALGNRLSVWLGSLTFLIFFAFGHFTELANYNFIAPYASQATHCFLGLLLVLWGLLRHLQTDKFRWLGVAGFGLAVAYLNKPEALLAAAGAIGLYGLAQTIRQVRTGKRRWAERASLWLAGGFLSLWLPVFGYFGWRGGGAYAFHAVNYAVLALFDPAIRKQVSSNERQLNFIGFDHPWDNFITQAWAGALLVGICGVMALLAWRWRSARKYSASWWGLPLGLAALAGFGIWLGVNSDAWLKIGPAFAFPVILVSFAAAVWSLEAARKGGDNFSRALGLAVVGVAASLMLARMILNARLSQYGFFMMPLAVWFWLQLMIVEAARFGKNTGAASRGWLLPAAFAVMVLAAAGQVLNFEVFFYARKTFGVGSGRDRMYTFAPILTKNGTKFTNGLMLNTMISAFKEKSPHARTLVAFPEGAAVNYHLRVPSTLAEAEFHPLALGYVGPEHVLAEMQAHPPDAVLVCYRNLAEYHADYFGQDEASGRSIIQWVREQYILAGKAGRSQLTLTGNAVDIYVPKPISSGLLNFGPY